MRNKLFFCLISHVLKAPEGRHGWSNQKTKFDNSDEKFEELRREVAKKDDSGPCRGQKSAIAIAEAKKAPSPSPRPKKIGFCLRQSIEINLIRPLFIN